jgi:hypothetical protein
MVIRSNFKILKADRSQKVIVENVMIPQDYSLL